MSEEQVVAYVGRHGTTALNKEDRYRGQKDVPLDDQGKQEAQEQAEFLANKPIGQAWSSDLSRAKDTAKAVLKGRNIKATPLESLRPLDAGKYTGQKKKDHEQDMKYYHEHTDERIPGGDSIDGMNKRVSRPLLRAMRAGLRTGKPSYLSAHSSVIHSLGHLLHNNHKAALVEPGGVVAVVFDGKKFYAVPVLKPKKEEAQEGAESAYAS
jgi:broad specificity phosphatase PhoE